MARILELTVSLYVDDDFDIHTESFTSWWDGWLNDLCGCASPAADGCRMAAGGIRCLTEQQYDAWLDREASRS